MLYKSPFLNKWDRIMLRLLEGLNRDDLLQELSALGITSPGQDLLASLQDRLKILVSGYEFDQVQQLMTVLEGQIPLQFLPPAGKPAVEKFLLLFPQQEISRFAVTWKKKFPPTAGTPGIPAALVSALSDFFNHLMKNEWVYDIPGGILKIDHPLLMGVLNVTPDSFSDGGNFMDPEAGYRHAVTMLEAGADIIDIGGESTRPGSKRITVEEEWKRIAPVLRRLGRSSSCVVSIDTRKSEIARRALEEGAHVINDISALSFDPAMGEVAAGWHVPVVLMHLKGTPETMQKNPSYHHLMEEVLVSLAERCRHARQMGVKQLIIDPGIGFGKRKDDNFEIIRRLRELGSLGYPILLGISRKSFIGKELNLDTGQRLVGTVTGVLYGVMQGASILRVHDVEAVKQCLTILQAIWNNKAPMFSGNPEITL